MRKKLLILGAGNSHIPIIKTAKRMGLYTIVMDKNPNAPGFEFCDKKVKLDGGNQDQVLKVAKNLKVNGILATGDYAVIPAAYASEKLGLATIGLKIALLVTNKGKLFTKFAKNDVPLPRRIIVTNYNEALKAAKKIGFPVILKPVYSFGASRGVIRVNNNDELLEKFRFTESFCLKKGIIVEQFVQGVEHTIESLTINGKTHVLAISDKKRTLNPFCVATSLDYPSKQNKHIISKLENVATIAIKTSGIKNGATHIEAISDGDNVYVIDFGGRGGAGGYIPSAIVPEINGIDMIKHMIKLVLGEKIDDVLLKPKFFDHVIYRFFTAKPGTVSTINGLKKVTKFKWLLDIKMHVKKGDKVEVLSNQLLRPGYFVVVGKSSDEAERRARLIERTVTIKTK